MKFEQTPFGNYVIEGDDFHISYNCRAEDNEVGRLCASILGLSGDSVEETALCYKVEGSIFDDWLILNGDFRKEYEEAISSGIDPRTVYDRNKRQHRSDWSTDQIRDS